MFSHDCRAYPSLVSPHQGDDASALGHLRVPCLGLGKGQSCTQLNAQDIDFCLSLCQINLDSFVVPCNILIHHAGVLIILDKCTYNSPWSALRYNIRPLVYLTLTLTWLFTGGGRGAVRGDVLYYNPSSSDPVSFEGAHYKRALPFTSSATMKLDGIGLYLWTEHSGKNSGTFNVELWSNGMSANHDTAAGPTSRLAVLATDRWSSVSNNSGQPRCYLSRDWRDGPLNTSDPRNFIYMSQVVTL